MPSLAIERPSLPLRSPNLGPYRREKAGNMTVRRASSLSGGPGKSKFSRLKERTYVVPRGPTHSLLVAVSVSSTFEHRDRVLTPGASLEVPARGSIDPSRRSLSCSPPFEAPRPPLRLHTQDGERKQRSPDTIADGDQGERSATDQLPSSSRQRDVQRTTVSTVSVGVQLSA